MADSNLVQFILQVRDELAAALTRNAQAFGQMGQQAQQAGQQLRGLPLSAVERAIDDLARKTQTAGNNQGQLQKAISDTERTLQQFMVTANAAGQVVDKFGNSLSGETVNKLRDLNTELAGTQRQLQDLQTHGINSASGLGVLSGAASTATGVLAAFGVSLSIRALVDLGRDTVDAGIKLQSFRAGLNFAAGGAQQGAEDFRFLQRETQRLGVDFLSTATAFKQFEAATKGTALEGEKARQIFTAFAEASRVLGLSANQSQHIFQALEQIVSKNVVSAEELRRQLGNFFPGIMQIAARATGETTAEFDKLLKSGTLIAETFLPALGRQVQKELGGAVPAAAELAQSSFARLGNEILFVKDQAADPLLRVLKAMADPIAKAMEGRRLAGEQRQQEVGKSVDVPGEVPQTPALQRLTTEQHRLEAALAIWLKRGEAGLDTYVTAQITAIREQLDQVREALKETVEPQARAMARNTEEARDEQPFAVPFAKQIDAVRKIRQDLEKELEGVTLRKKLFPDLDVVAERAKVTEKALEEATDAIRKFSNAAVAGGLPPALTRELAALQGIGKREDVSGDRREAAAKAQREGEQAARKREREIEQARIREAREAQQEDEKTARALERDITTLERKALALRNVHSSGEENLALTIAERNPNNERIQQLAEEIKLRALVNEGIDEETRRSNEALANELAVLKTKEDYLRKLENTLQQLSAPREERLEVRLRQEGTTAGLDPDEQRTRDDLLGRIQAQQQRNREAKLIEDQTRQLTRSIEQAFSTLWESVFSGGVTSARDFGVQVAQALQRLFGQLASQLTTTLLNALADPQGKDGGWAGALAKVLVNVGVAAFGGSVGGTGTGGVDTGAGSGGVGSVMLQGTGGIVPALRQLPEANMAIRHQAKAFRQFATGGIVREPTMALIGEVPGQFEAVVPLPDGRTIPVTMMGQRGQQMQREQPIIIQMSVNPANMIDPRIFKSTPQEIVSVVAKDISQDGITRRVIVQKTR